MGRVVRRRQQPRSFGAKVAQWGRAGLGAASAAANAYSASRSFTNQRRNVKHAPGPITGESDYRSVYRRKPMPRRRRRRWVRFTRKVKAVAEKQVAPQFQVLRRDVISASSPDAQNATSVFTVLGSNGIAEADDIFDMMTSAFNMAGTTGLTGATVAGTRIHISGWMAECMINNNTTTTTYIDCYYWRAKKDIPVSYSSINNLVQTGFAQIAQTTVGPTTPNALDIQDYGVTPFQCPLFSQAVQVYKKTRIKLGPNGTAQLELRSGKNHYRKWSYDSAYAFLRGVSEGIYFIHYGTPGTGSPGRRSGATNLTFSVNVNYTWRRMSDDRMSGVAGDD